MQAPAQTTAQPANTTNSELLYGVLDADVRQFRFAIEVKKNDAGGSDGELLSIDEGGHRFTLDNFSKTEQALEFEIKASSAKYTGAFDESKQAYVGKWEQRTAELELELRPVQTIPEQKLKAVWAGQLSVLFQKLDLQFRELESGKVFFDSVTQKAGGFVTNKNVEGNEVTFDVQGIPGGAKFVGTLSADGTELTGKWKQGLLPINLVLKKQASIQEKPTVTESAASTPNRPQTPQPPFPYTTTDVTFENEQATITLAGTLTVPNGTGPFPAVVLVSGSGPQDRDESILGHKPFWIMADHFSRNGIAVLRFDDRGVGKSEGEFAEATSEDFATDAGSAVEFLRARSDIKPEKIGLCGHSEGGIIAPLLAIEDPELAFIILMAGPGVNGEKILASQARLILEATGIDSATVDRQGKIQAELLRLAMKTPQLSSEEFIEQAQGKISEFDAELSEESVKSMAAAAATQLVSPWFRYFLSYEPGPVLAQVRCPVLAIVGEKDLQVDPKLNIPALQAALDQAPTRDVTIQELPGLNHLFQRCNTGMVSEYAEIEETISPEVLKLMTQWILERVK